MKSKILLLILIVASVTANIAMSNEIFKPESRQYFLIEDKDHRPLSILRNDGTTDIKEYMEMMYEMTGLSMFHVHLMDLDKNDNWFSISETRYTRYDDMLFKKELIINKIK